MHDKNKLLILIGIIFFVFYQFELNSQNVSIPDSIIIYKKSGKNILFDFRVQKGNTIYGISKYFDVDIMNIYGYNPQLQVRELDINSNILVPFNIELLSGDKYCEGTKVYYRVGLKENLFRIAKVYFHLDVSDVMRKNNLKDHVISPGQLLFLGNVCKEKTKPYLNDDYLIKNDKPVNKKIVNNTSDKDSLKREKPVFVKTVEIANNNELLEKSDTVLVQKVEEKVLQDKGLAIWNKGLDINGVFVLHNDAKLFSLMELYNPVVNTSIVAKVIGRIPENTYPDNVKLILSPEAAKTLGALDQRFFVKFKYLK